VSAPVETTLAKFRGQRASNYSTMPTIDVPILPDIRLCQGCGKEVKQVPDGSWFRWVHADAPDGPSDHWVSNATRCRYCHSQDAQYRQHAWYDAVECERCGGVDGFAIGD